MRVLFEITHTGCDREIMRSGLGFDAYHPKGWNDEDRPRPPNIRVVHSPREFQGPYDVAVVGTEETLRCVSPEVPVVWKCLTDYGTRSLPEHVLSRIFAWVAASEETAERWGMASNPKTHIIEHGIDSDVFGNHLGGNGLLSVVNLLPIRPERGPGILRGVAAKLPETIPVHLIGFGNEKMASDKGIQVLGRCESMEALATQYRSHDVYFNSCSVIVCAVLEAMATGMPVVTMRPGNFVGLMRHRENCFIAETEEEAIYFIELLTKNPALRCEIGSTARESVQFRFHPEIAAHRWKMLLLEAKDSKEGG